MEIEYKIIELTQTGETCSLAIRTIRQGEIPAMINGESGAHVCYIVALTQMMLRQLNRESSDHPFTEDEIQTISLAASLHDVGKQRLPEAILEKKGALTPVEYDIIKKHAAIGAELIEKAGGSLPPVLRQTAAEIAHYHHERWDGTGYPDGLAGDAIPAAAQVVSIVDAYEALTSPRSYKQAFSSDVALEMIENGMCGVFSPALVRCLMRIVGQKQLEDLRASLTLRDSFYTVSGRKAVGRVLFLGNTMYLTEQFLHNTFPGAKICVIGRTALKPNPTLRIFDPEKRNYSAILATYDFDVVVYFSQELSYRTEEPSDMETLRQILEALAHLPDKTKLLYLSSLDTAVSPPEDRGILAQAKETLCQHWAQRSHAELKILRIPYLYSGTVKHDYLHRLFEKMEENSKIKLDQPENARLAFLSLSDLSELLNRIVEVWSQGGGALTVGDEFAVTAGELAQALSNLKAGVKFTCDARGSVQPPEIKNTALRMQYGWFARVSILAGLAEEYEAFRSGDKPGKRRPRHTRGTSQAQKLAELAVLFALTELMVRGREIASLFSVVDFRLAFVVLMGTVHGLGYGLAAAALASVSLCAEQIASGVSAMSLFYELTNWVPFLIFFLVGAACGYVKVKNENNIHFVQEENKLLQKKLSFNRRLYEDLYNEKQDLKKQIISSKDSFGKIFHVVRQLDTVDARELCLRMVETFEDMLDNRTVSIYSVSEGAAFARLEAASRSIIEETAASLLLSRFDPVMQTLAKGDIWRNTAMLPKMPMYACGIYRAGKPQVLIFLWQAQMHQKSLYYVNLFRILCELARFSMLRAYNYSALAWKNRMIPGTRIQNAETFAASLRSFRELAQKQVFHFIMLEVERDGRTLQELDELLRTCVRTNDVVGVTRSGTVRILLAQTTAEHQQTIVSRYRACGVNAHPVQEQAV